MFFKIGFIKDFAMLTGKHLCWSLFNNFIEKRDSNTGDFCEYCKIILRAVFFFYRTPVMAAC